MLPKKEPQPHSSLKYEVSGIAIIAAALFLAAGLLDLSVGRIGYFAARVLRYGFGLGAAGIPVLLFIIGLRYVTAHSHVIYSRRFVGYLLVYSGVLSLFHHYMIGNAQEILPENLPQAGGLLGGSVIMVLRRLFAMDGTTIFLWAWILCALLLATGFSVSEWYRRSKEWFAAKKSQQKNDDLNVPAVIKEKNLSNIDVQRPSIRTTFYNQEKDEPVIVPILNSDPVVHPVVPDVRSRKGKNAGTSVEPVKETESIAVESAAVMPSHYKVPSLSLLKKTTNPKNPRLEKQIADHARTLEHTLESFGIQARVVHATQGPAVTRYELEPAPGVKISRIVNLSDDIALKLAAPSIRIEAPIPGKSVIGIEVPNSEVFGVSLREVMENGDYQSSASLLTVALGKDIAGQSIMADLAKMPHLLVAGATGSGKSICINILISSILFRAHPDAVKFLLIDPKVVELSNYNGIPHLVAPVVTEPKKAASALKWTVQEMERRYALFAAAGVRDVTRYNEVNPAELLPLIVVIIDELADLMMVAPVDVEDSICRLAQMARASGIHLVIATQRPSVDVITGTIKANIPSRISFAVTSQIDSRTILDMAGAEKLLGKGDMLYYPVGASKPVRLQGAYISDTEIEALVRQIKDVHTTDEEVEVPIFEEQVASSNTARFEDDLLEEAVKLVLETGQASVSLLQRKFRVGYTRAARLVDMMEEMQIVSAANGSKPREVIMNSDQVFSRYFSKS